MHLSNDYNSSVGADLSRPLPIYRPVLPVDDLCAPDAYRPVFRAIRQ